MKKKLILGLICLMSVATCFTGCGKKEEAATSVAEESEKEDEEAAAIMAEDETEEEAEVLPDKLLGSNVIIDGDDVYYVGQSVISRLNTKTGKSENIWVDPDSDNTLYYRVYSGMGILVGDNLYFTFSKEIGDYTSYNTELYVNVIDKDGKGFKTIDTYSQDYFYSCPDLYYEDGILYVASNDIDFGYELDESGNVTKRIETSDMEDYFTLPEGYRYKSFFNMGQHLLTSKIASEYGELLPVWNEEHDLVIYDMDNGSETVIGGSLSSFNGDKLLINEYKDEEYYYGTIDVKTGEYSYLLRVKSGLSVMYMDDESLYYVVSEGNDNSFYRQSLKGGKSELLYTAKASDTALNINAASYAPVVFDGERIYTFESHDAAVYPEVYDVNEGKAIIGDKPVYDSGISAIGKLKKEKLTATSDDGQLLVDTMVCIPIIDSSIPGAEEINKELDGFFKSGQIFIDEYRADAEEWGDDEYFANYSYEATLEKIQYYDNGLLSFYVEGYEYYGGAHGMPFHAPYTFDVQTGTRLKLSDIVGVSEEELTDIVVDAFAKKIDENGGIEYYWDDALDTVRTYVDIDFYSWYLTEDGVVFYFGPYELASYAAGFQSVTVPFDTLKVDFDNISVETAEE